MILTINRIKALDLFLGRIISALDRLVSWLQDKHDAAIINLGYKAVEDAAKSVNKVKDKILDLEDDACELAAQVLEEKAMLQKKYKDSLAALDKAFIAKKVELDNALAEAAEALVEANKRYDSTVKAVNDELGVEVNG